MVKSHPMENLLPQKWDQLSTTYRNATEVAQWGAPSWAMESFHSEIRTMSSETVDSIDWPLPPTLHRGVLRELHVLHGVNAGYKSQNLLQQLGREHAFLGMTGQCTACTVTRLLLLLLLKNIGNARPGEGDCHPISPKTPAPH